MRPLPKELVRGLKKSRDCIIAVDVASGSQYSSVDFAVENIANVPSKTVKDLREFLEWEGFKARVKTYTGDEDEEDEGWAWKKLGFPVMSFIVPIEGKDDSWHRIQEDNTCTATTVRIAVQGLTRLACFISGLYI